MRGLEREDAKVKRIILREREKGEERKWLQHIPGWYILEAADQSPK